MVQKHELIAQIDVLLGGRACEELFINEISTGASNDLERCTDIAKSMMMYYGMTDEVGLMVLEKQRNAFLGGGLGSSKEYSEKTSERVDGFVRNLLNERYERVKSVLKQYEAAIVTMSEELLEVEVMDGAKVKKIIKAHEKKHDLVNERDEAEKAEKAEQDKIKKAQAAKEKARKTREKRKKAEQEKLKEEQPKEEQLQQEETEENTTDNKESKAVKTSDKAKQNNDKESKSEA